MYVYFMRTLLGNGTGISYSPALNIKALRLSWSFANFKTFKTNAFRIFQWLLEIFQNIYDILSLFRSQRPFGLVLEQSSSEQSLYHNVIYQAKAKLTRQ